MMTISIVPSLEQQNSFFEREIKTFPIRKAVAKFLENILTRYLKKLNSLLDQFYVELQGALVVVHSYSSNDAKRDLPHVRKGIRLLTTYNSFLEQTSYFDSQEVRTKFGLVLSAFYDLEVNLKKRAFEGQPQTSTSAALLNELAAKSREAIQMALSH